MRRVASISQEGWIICVFLFAAGISGLIVAVISDPTSLLTVGAFTIGIILSLYKRRYTSLNTLELERADPLPEGVRIESNVEIALRLVPMLAVIGVGYLVAMAIGPALVAALAGFITGQGASECRGAFLCQRWERDRSVTLYSDVPRLHYYQKDALQNIYSRPDASAI